MQFRCVFYSKAPPASALTPAIIMQLCDEIVANLSQAARQRTEASEADRQRQNVVTVAPGNAGNSDACVDTMAMSETGVVTSWRNRSHSVISESADYKSDEVNREVYMQSMMNDDHKSLKVCVERKKKQKQMRTEVQETFGLKCTSFMGNKSRSSSIQEQRLRNTRSR